MKLEFTRMRALIENELPPHLQCPVDTLILFLG